MQRRILHDSGFGSDWVGGAPKVGFLTVTTGHQRSAQPRRFRVEGRLGLGVRSPDYECRNLSDAGQRTGLLTTASWWLGTQAMVNGGGDDGELPWLGSFLPTSQVAVERLMSDDADLLAYYRIAFDACVSPRAPSVSELEYVLRTALSLLLVEGTRRGYGRSGVGWAAGAGCGTPRCQC